MIDIYNLSRKNNIPTQTASKQALSKYLCSRLSEKVNTTEKGDYPPGDNQPWGIIGDDGEM